MLNILDRSHIPSLEELIDYAENPVFEEFYREVSESYKALYSIQYSGDNRAGGWNLKLRKAGRALCVMYPKKGRFTVLVVVGTKEKERAEALLPRFSEYMRRLYLDTPEGMGQRWLMIDLSEKDGAYQDTLQLIRLRREKG